MSITLNTYANGDTNYVSKLNQDNSTLQNAINNLLTSVGSGNQFTMSNLVLALFGVTATTIGTGSYVQTTSGTNMTLQPGYAWKPSTLTIVQLGSSTVLNFSGQSAGTYYVAVDPTGTPVIQTGASDALYTVVWSGTAFTSVTMVANVFFDATAEKALLTSTANNATYATLLARLEAIETAAKTVASSSVFGVVKVDGSTITASGGVISATSAVSSVGLSMPSRFTVAGSPITTSGTLTVTENSQSANQFLAGPASGGSAAPGYRAIVAADLPIASSTALGVIKGDGATVTISASGVLSATGSGGTVSSISVTVPSRMSVSPATITTSGTFAITDNNQNANLVFAGPSSGSAAAPTFRQLIAADLPVATTSAFGAVKPDGTSITISSGVISAVPSAAPSGNPSYFYATPSSGSGSASLRAIVPADLPTATTSALGIVKPDGSTVTITAAGVISAVVAAPSGSANTFYATPNGSTGAATLRSIVPADLPVATPSALGIVRADGTTLTNASGVLSVVTAALPMTVTFNLTSAAVATNVCPLVAAPRAAALTSCVIITKTADSGTALQIDVLQNGTSVFPTTKPSVAAGTAAGTVSTFSLSSASIAVAKNDVFQVNVTSGTTTWQATIQLES